MPDKSKSYVKGVPTYVKKYEDDADVDIAMYYDDLKSLKTTKNKKERDHPTYLQINNIYNVFVANLDDKTKKGIAHAPGATHASAKSRRSWTTSSKAQAWLPSISGEGKTHTVEFLHPSSSNGLYAIVDQRAPKRADLSSTYSTRSTASEMGYTEVFGGRQQQQQPREPQSIRRVSGSCGRRRRRNLSPGPTMIKKTKKKKK